MFYRVNGRICIREIIEKGIHGAFEKVFKDRKLPFGPRLGRYPCWLKLVYLFSMLLLSRLDLQVFCLIFNETLFPLWISGNFWKFAGQPEA